MSPPPELLRNPAPATRSAAAINRSRIELRSRIHQSRIGSPAASVETVIRPGSLTTRMAGSSADLRIERVRSPGFPIGGIGSSLAIRRIRTPGIANEARRSKRTDTTSANDVESESEAIADLRRTSNLAMAGGSSTSARNRCTPPERGCGVSSNCPSTSTRRVDSVDARKLGGSIPKIVWLRSKNSAAVPTLMRTKRLRSLRRVGLSAVDGVRQTNHPNPKRLANTAINVTNTPDVQHARPAPVTAPKPIAIPTSPPVGGNPSFTLRRR